MAKVSEDGQMSYGINHQVGIKATPDDIYRALTETEKRTHPSPFERVIKLSVSCDLLVRASPEDNQVFVDLLQLPFGSVPNHVVAGSYQTNV
jgi:hypothetical protein